MGGGALDEGVCGGVEASLVVGRALEEGACVGERSPACQHGGMVVCSSGVGGSESRVWCFQCGAGYAAEVASCVECGVATVNRPPADAAEVGAKPARISWSTTSMGTPRSPAR